MKKFISAISTFCFALLMGLINFAPSTFASAEDNPARTIFMVSPTLIASAQNKTYVYDSTDMMIKKIETTASESSSYFVGEIRDMCAHENEIFMLTSSGIKVFDVDSLQFSEFSLDWMTESYTKISVSQVDTKTIVAVYGQTISVAIKTAEYITGTTPVFSDVAIADLTHGTNVGFLSYAFFDDTEYLIRTSESHVVFYPLVIGTDTTLNTTTVIEGIENPNDIVGIHFNGNLIVTYASKTDKFSCQKSAASIDIALLESISHYFSLDEPLFEAKNTSLSGETLYILSSDCYYALNTQTMQFSGNRTNALCTEHYYQNKADYKYYKVVSDTNLISTLGNSNYISVPQNSFVVEIASSTLSDGSALVGYKFVLFASVNDEGDYTNYYGYIISDNCLEEIDIAPSTDVVHTLENTKIFEYPSVFVTMISQDNQNKVLHTTTTESPVNIIAYLDEYATGAGENAVHYALVDCNGHVGYIDSKTIISSDRRVINTMPNAKIIAGTNVYEEANASSTVIEQLETGKNVRIIGTRDRNGFIKIAFNTSNGRYYEGYILASSVRSNSYTVLQTIGTVLVVLNVILLSVLIATKKRIAK